MQNSKGHFLQKIMQPRAKKMQTLPFTTGFRMILIWSFLAPIQNYPQQELSGRYEMIDAKGVRYYISGNPQKFCAIHFVFPRKSENNEVNYQSSPDDVRAVSKKDCSRIESLLLNAVKKAKKISVSDLKPGFMILKTMGKTEMYSIQSEQQEFLELSTYLRSFWIP
ncbi:hypothetical protein [Turneriella parva]|uniref:Uncharacterized protein n=1 Tax=Turneriella parva (strain ATCC BAA-1111 / DSM 21527 / NCTC 11395 / H) TaxID=869212 RepID=I4B3Y5_TURPD|nr:hypothetical protein [Turneriella parva]AFM11992.1 hypothetical protein Turpa_1344 [Turneriella parva DSM 21527]